MSVSRLPVQHKKHPHCPACKRDLPTFNDVQILTDMGHAEVYAVTFHMECTCGQLVDLRKSVKRT